ncbi:MAG: DUF4242 domain-containing protein [Blastocatellales bacterium]|nr:DUF4242 domain-containing protein [Blastocatellales bacterium]
MKLTGVLNISVVSVYFCLFRYLSLSTLGVTDDTGNNNQLTHTARRCVMPKYVIEREIPGAGKLSAQELNAISQKSCSVLDKLGPQIQWLQSYVTGDKIYCVYIAPNEEIVREHAQQGGFPANRISVVTAVIDPTTAE